MVSLTKTGLVFLGLTGMLYLGALQSETGLLYLILGVLVGCALLNAIGARRSVNGIELVLPPVITAFEGQKLDEGWLVRSRSKRTVGLVTVSGPWGELVRVGTLEPGEEAARTPECVLTRRGVYPFSSLSVRSAYPFGWIQCKRPLPLQGEIIVYPAVYRCDAPAAAGYEPMVGGHFTGGKRSRSGTHFSGVRPHQSGDALRSIHWKSSARGRGLMVKSFEEELSGRVSLILDAGARSTAGGTTTLDWAARAAASLMMAALDQGHHVEFIDLATLQKLTVAPFSDGSAVLDALARLAPRTGCLTAERLGTAVATVSQKSSLCFIVSNLPPSLEQFLRDPRLQRRKVSLYVPAMRDIPEVPGIPTRRFMADGLEPQAKLVARASRSGGEVRAEPAVPEGAHS